MIDRNILPSVLPHTYAYIDSVVAIGARIDGFAALPCEEKIRIDAVSWRFAKQGGDASRRR